MWWKNELKLKSIVTFDGNVFYPAEGMFKKVFADLLHSYCLGENRSIQALACSKKFYCNVITMAFFSR